MQILLLTLRIIVVVDFFQQVKLQQELLFKQEVNVEGVVPDCFTNSSPANELVLACA